MINNDVVTIKLTESFIPGTDKVVQQLNVIIYERINTDCVIPRKEFTIEFNLPIDKNNFVKGLTNLAKELNNYNTNEE